MAERAFPLSHVYRLLEPGSVVLVTTAHMGKANIMAQSWHTMIEFEPPLAGIDDCSGKKLDKFKKFKLTPLPASQVEPPQIAECCANLECRVVDAKLVNKHNFFVLEVVKAWVDPAKKQPRTLHHRGKGSSWLRAKRSGCHPG